MDAYQSSGSSPNSILLRDCWLTLDDGVVLIAREKQHRDYFVPEGEKPSKQFGLDRGFIRVSTLGTNGSTLHFEFRNLSSQTSRLIVDAIEQSRAETINLELHSPQYTLRSNLSPQEAVSFLQRDVPETTNIDLVFENHFSLFLIRPVSSTGQSWLDENIDSEAQTFGNAVACEPRYVEAILQGAIDAGLEVA